MGGMINLTQVLKMEGINIVSQYGVQLGEIFIGGKKDIHLGGDGLKI